MLEINLNIELMDGGMPLGQSTYPVSYQDSPQQRISGVQRLWSNKEKILGEHTVSSLRQKHSLDGKGQRKMT